MSTKRHSVMRGCVSAGFGLICMKLILRVNEMSAVRWVSEARVWHGVEMKPSVSLVFGSVRWMLALN